MTDDPTIEESLPASTDPSPDKTGQDDAWEWAERLADKWLALLNDPEAVKRGEKRFDDAIEPDVLPYGWDEESSGKAER